jgi:hypothetical protein
MNTSVPGGPAARAERRWRWAALLLSAAVLSIGCNPMMLSYFLIPWADDKVQPDCPLASREKEVKVAVVVVHANPEIRSELTTVDRQLSQRLAQLLEERFKENKDKVTVVPAHQVNSYLNKRPSGATPHEVGKHFQADYVITLEINAMSLFEGSYNQFYRGKADIAVTVTDARKPVGEGEKFTQPYQCEYPSAQRFVEASDMPWAHFRARFVERIAKDLVQRFAAHPPKERYDSD